MELETFNEWSKIYEASTGGVTRELAARIVFQLPPITLSSVILDNGAGPGIVTEEVLKTGLANDIAIHVVDVSPPMIDHAITNFASCPNIKCAVMPGENLDFPDETFTHSITNIAILVFEDGPKGAREIYRTLKATSDLSSMAVVTSWTFLGFGQPMREACLAVRPGEEPFSLPIDKVWFDPAHLEKVMKEAGFGENVEVHIEEFAMGVANLHLLFEAFRPEMKKALVGWTEDEFDKYKSEFVRIATKSATLMKGGDGNEKLAVPMRASVAICRK
ncbi:S-adenosyl-L-methionine-dependent methyltransferase [Naviculisporaceae sp. PSN 640]